MSRKILLMLFCLVVHPLALGAQEDRAAGSWWRNNFRISGEIRQETAVRVASPRNLSKLKEIGKLDLKFVFNDHFKLKVGGRAWVDAVYDLTNQYPEPVASNMRAEALLRDAYLDVTYPGVNLRVGHQQIVWGEALGRFFADVVTPKDLREFFLQSFDDIRLPIWAIDAQFTPFSNLNIELVLSPDRQVDKFALPGADFAFRLPVSPGAESVLLEDNRPDTDFKHWNAGLRLAYYVSGWDLSAFYYTSPDHLPGLAKTASADPLTGDPVILIEPVHERVHHGALTFSKGVGDSMIARGEVVLTAGRLFSTGMPGVDRGLQARNQLRYVVGFDYDIGGHLLVNGEFQQEAILGSRGALTDQMLGSWLFLRFSARFLDDRLRPELIAVVGLDGGDTHFGPRLSFDVIDALQLTWGADIFSGPNGQLYGQFDGQDRVFMNTQWKF